MATLAVDALDTALGPRVRLTLSGRPLLLTTREARQLATWLLDAADLAEQTPQERGDPHA
jgi:hypothetical protein